MKREDLISGKNYINGELSKLNKEMSAIDYNLTTDENKITNFENEITELESKIASSSKADKKRYEDTKKVKENEIAKIKVEMETLKSKKETIKASIDYLNKIASKFEECVKVYTEFEKATTDKDTKKEELKEKIDDLEKEMHKKASPSNEKPIFTNLKSILSPVSKISEKLNSFISTGPSYDSKNGSWKLALGNFGVRTIVEAAVPSLISPGLFIPGLVFAAGITTYRWIAAPTMRKLVNKYQNVLSQAKTDREYDIKVNSILDKTYERTFDKKRSIGLTKIFSKVKKNKMEPVSKINEYADIENKVNVFKTTYLLTLNAMPDLYTKNFENLTDAEKSIVNNGIMMFEHLRKLLLKNPDLTKTKLTDFDITEDELKEFLNRLKHLGKISKIEDYGFSTAHPDINEDSAKMVAEMVKNDLLKTVGGRNLKKEELKKVFDSYKAVRELLIEKGLDYADLLGGKSLIESFLKKCEDGGITEAATLNNELTEELNKKADIDKFEQAYEQLKGKDPKDITEIEKNTFVSYYLKLVSPSANLKTKFDEIINKIKNAKIYDEINNLEAKDVKDLTDVEKTRIDDLLADASLDVALKARVKVIKDNIDKKAMSFDIDRYNELVRKIKSKTISSDELLEFKKYDTDEQKRLVANYEKYLAKIQTARTGYETRKDVRANDFVTSIKTYSLAQFATDNLVLRKVSPYLACSEFKNTIDQKTISDGDAKTRMEVFGNMYRMMDDSQKQVVTDLVSEADRFISTYMTGKKNNAQKLVAAEEYMKLDEEVRIVVDSKLTDAQIILLQEMNDQLVKAGKTGIR